MLHSFSLTALNSQYCQITRLHLNIWGEDLLPFYPMLAQSGSSKWCVKTMPKPRVSLRCCFIYTPSDEIMYVSDWAPVLFMSFLCCTDLRLLRSKFSSLERSKYLKPEFILVLWLMQMVITHISSMCHTVITLHDSWIAHVPTLKSCSSRVNLQSKAFLITLKLQ